MIASEPTPSTAEPPPPSLTGRLIQLDVLRGVAILLVLGRHPLSPPEQAGILQAPALAWFHLGWTGVDLFFVLSGFLVGGLLLREVRIRGSLDVKRFMIRRALKIWPAYYALVGAALIVSLAHRGMEESLEKYGPNLLHIQNYLGTNPLGQTWSLAIEEHFYVVMPLLLWCLTGFGRRRGAVDWLPGICLGVMAGCIWGRCAIYARHHYGFWAYQFPTHLRVDGLAFGVMLAYFHHLRPELLRRVARHRWALLIAGAGLVSPMAVLDLTDSPFVWLAGYPLLYLGYGCILIAAVYTPADATGGVCGRFFMSHAARCVGLIGLYSYSIYLWQMVLVVHPMEWLLEHHFPSNWIVVMGVQVLGACAAGIVMAKLIEFPVIALRDQLFPARAKAMQ